MLCEGARRGAGGARRGTVPHSGVRGGGRLSLVGCEYLRGWHVRTLGHHIAYLLFPFIMMG